ncbi:MAG: DUF402 domain-containing protein [Bacilli bacterium]|jgi:protein associated with RNAse G/E
MENSLIHKWVEVQSFKHDGNIHRIWKRNFVLEENEDWLIVANHRTKVIEGNGRIWYTREPAVTFFSKKMWFNAIAMIKPEGIHFYVNVASPTLIDAGIAKYIDYDLDFKTSDEKGLSFLDRNEFRKHIVAYEYEEDLVEIIRNQTIETQKLIIDKKFPFDVDAVSKYYETFLEKTKK